MAADQRFILKFKGSYLSQTWMNVFYFHQSSGADAAQALTEAWDDAIPTYIAPLQAAGCTYTAIETINLDNPADFYSMTPTVTAGSDLGSGLPAYVATSFMYHRATRLVRNGWKRFTGVTELMNDSGVLDAAYTAEANALAAVLANYVESGANRWYPKIGRVVYSETGVPTYTLFDMSDVSFVRLSTQNTRKV